MQSVRRGCSLVSSEIPLGKNKLRDSGGGRVVRSSLPYCCFHAGVSSVTNTLLFMMQEFESDYFQFKSKTLDFDRRLGTLLCEGLSNCSGLESAFKVSSWTLPRK